MTSKINNEDLYIFTFYRFIRVKNKVDLKIAIEDELSYLIVRGTILVADEGIN